jgi:TetR/AcrR family transcriptional repressor of nem operon
VNDRRTAILDAAASLIAEKGFSQTSVEDVIKRSGLCGKGHFYHYFSSKDELGLEVLDRQFERFAERGLAMLREPMIAPLDRLGLFIDSFVATQVQCGCRFGSPFGRLAMEMCDAREEFRARLATVFERWAGQIESLLWEARPQFVDPVDTARLSRFIIATLEGAMMMSRVNRDAKVLEGIAADLKRFVWAHTRSGSPVAADT